MPESAQYTRLSDANTGLYTKWSYGLTRLEKQLIVLATIFGIVIFALAIALARCESKVHPPTPSPNITTTEAPTTTVTPPSSTTTPVTPPSSTTTPVTPPSSTTTPPTPPSSTTTPATPPSSTTTPATPPSSTTTPVTPPSSTTTPVTPPSSTTTTVKPPSPNPSAVVPTTTSTVPPTKLTTNSVIPAGLQGNDTKIPLNPEVTTEANVQKEYKVEAPEEVTKGETAYESILKKAEDTTEKKTNFRLNTGANFIRIG